MRWIIRLAVLALCFSLGTSVWYILAQERTIPSPPVQATEEVSVSPPDIQPVYEEPTEMLGHSVRFEPVEALSANVNTKLLVLRQSADASAPVVAKLKMESDESVEILETTRDFLRIRVAANDGTYNGGIVREHDYEGWVKWGSVVPQVTAIVLDAESGELVSRVPLDDSLTSVAYAPDGSKALFFSASGGQLAREVRTSDYAFTRRLLSEGNESFRTPFYGSAGDTLYVAAYQQGNSQQTDKISLVSVGPEGGPNIPIGISTDDAEFIAVSPDGSKAFIARRHNRARYELTIDVMEVATRQLSNTFTLVGTNLPSNAETFILSTDGSELYVQTSEKSDTISVIDTRTGERVRELPYPSESGCSYITQENLVGDSLLLRIWVEGEDMTAALSCTWVSSGQPLLAEPDVDYAVEAAGRRYAVNEGGDRFFQLDENNRIKASFPIARPELYRGVTKADDLTIYGISASPDGKRIILFIGFVHSC